SAALVISVPSCLPVFPTLTAHAELARSGQDGPGSGRPRSGRSAGGTTLRTTPGAGEGPPCRSAGHSPAAFVGRPRCPLGPAQSPVVVGAHSARPCRQSSAAPARPDQPSAVGGAHPAQPGPAQPSAPPVLGDPPACRIVRPAGMKRPLVHLPEPACPCCRQALGESSEMTPHEGSHQV